MSGVLESTSLIQQASAAIENTYTEYEATALLARAADERAQAAFDEAADARPRRGPLATTPRPRPPTPPTRPRRTPPSGTG